MCEWATSLLEIWIIILKLFKWNHSFVNENASVDRFSVGMFTFSTPNAMVSHLADAWVTVMRLQCKCVINLWSLLFDQVLIVRNANSANSLCLSALRRSLFHTLTLFSIVKVFLSFNCLSYMMNNMNALWYPILDLNDQCGHTDKCWNYQHSRKLAFFELTCTNPHTGEPLTT